MPVRTTVPRTTHQWLKNLYTYIDLILSEVVPSGASGIANAAWYGKGVPQVQIGNATGAIGFYGFTGIAQIATGGNGILAATAMGPSGLPGTGLGASGFYTQLANAAFNGGTGNAYTINDLVTELKNAGLLKA